MTTATTMYRRLWEDEKDRWALLLTEKGKMERELNDEIDRLYRRIRDLRDALREERLDGHASSCSDCHGTGGDPIEADVTTADGMSISHTEVTGHNSYLSAPCETCDGTGYLA